MTEPNLARLIVIALATLAGLGLLGVIVLAYQDKSTEVLTGLTGAALGALATLATTRTGIAPEEMLAASEARMAAIDEVNALDPKSRKP